MRTIPVAVALVVCALSGPATGRSRLGVGRAGRRRRLHGVRRVQHQGHRQARQECRLSQTKAAFFRSAKHDATYKVCVKFPGKKRRLCASAQDAPKGQKKYVTIATASTGKHKVAWYVGGTKVGCWNFRASPPADLAA